MLKLSSALQNTVRHFGRRPIPGYDIVFSGGKNIYICHVEFGEARFAVIVPANEWENAPEKIVAHCPNHIGGDKIPCRMAFKEKLPKCAIGKRLKQKPRNTYAEAYQNPQLQESA